MRGMGTCASRTDTRDDETVDDAAELVMYGHTGCMWSKKQARELERLYPEGSSRLRIVWCDRRADLSSEDHVRCRKLRTYPTTHLRTGKMIEGYASHQFVLNQINGA